MLVLVFVLVLRHLPVSFAFAGVDAGRDAGCDEGESGSEGLGELGGRAACLRSLALVDAVAGAVVDGLAGGAGATAVQAATAATASTKHLLDSHILRTHYHVLPITYYRRRAKSKCPLLF